MRSIVEARASCRVDLAGGTLDIWPLGLLHPGARTVNLAIDRRVGVRLRRAEGNAGYQVRQDTTVRSGSLEDLFADPATALVAHVCSYLDLPPLEVDIDSQSPRGGGLGASSAMTVALLAAGRAVLDKAPLESHRAAAVARDLEARLMSLPTGTQDHFPALFGGVLEINFQPGQSVVRSIDHDHELSDALVVAYSGQSHFSAGNNWQVVRRRLEGEAEVTERLGRIAEVASRMAQALRDKRYRAAGLLMSEEWSHRRQLAAAVSTERVELLLEIALAAGAWGGKVCGAGGGGCLAWLVPPERRPAVVEALREAGAEVLRAAVAEGGIELTSE